MALTSGTRLGPYEIQSPLGAGGMGEVYRARDTRLDRTVAVKIVPSHLSDNPESRRRFEREARTISSLNHPHICTLHDVGSQDGTSYLVMEYLQGEGLDTRLQKGPLPLKQALECGIQICDALEKAHRAGIVHRDLKPGNIMLTASGAKLLDFGLAKPAAAMLGAQSIADKGNLTPSTPTMNVSMLSATPAALTQQGTIVGTFQYMAPEVAQGKDADARSDIFSLGCVLYEMVTGRRAFEGKSQLSVLTAILEKDPEPLATLQPTTPPALDYAVQTCLEKNPDNRFQTAHDVKLQLAWIAKTGSQTGPSAVVPGKSNKNTLWLAALAVLALVAIALAAAMFLAREPRRVLRSNILPPEGTLFETLYRNGAPALSPDGTHVAFVGRKDEKNSLWVRSLDKLEASPLRGTEEAFFPFWSPDGSALAFFMHGKLWRMDLNGGSPIAICDAAEGRGGSWGRGNVIVFSPSTVGPIMQVAAAGGTPQPITKPPKGVVESDRWPVFLPDSNHFLYLHTLNGDADERNEIHFASLAGEKERVLLRGRYYMFQYASGWLLADRSGSLLAWRFDPSSGRLSGDAVQVVDKIASDEITAATVFSVSGQGILLYQPGSGATGDRHIWLDAAGKQLSQISGPGIYGGTRLSPDGSRVATAVVKQGSGNSDLWIWDLAGGARAPLSTGDFFVDSPVWSADGRTIYFGISDANGHEEVRDVPADGSQLHRTLIKADTDVVPSDGSSDGKWLLYEEAKQGPAQDSVLKAFPLAAGLESFTVLESVAINSNARLKPASNNWLAYQSNESGRSEIYLTRFPHPNAKYQVSQTGGSQVVWSKDGKKLYYLDSSQKMTVVDVQTANDSVQIGAPRTLFQTGVRHSIPDDAYDVTHDGRFLIVNSVMESTAPVVLVTNWDAELKK